MVMVASTLSFFYAGKIGILAGEVKRRGGARNRADKKKPLRRGAVLGECRAPYLELAAI
jgi:hypothetical protein